MYSKLRVFETRSETRVVHQNLSKSASLVRKTSS